MTKQIVKAPGPFVNAFRNDLVPVLEYLCSMYNYADDNTVGVCAINKDILCSTQTSLEHVSDFMFTWSTDDFTQANPSKFQMITFWIREHISCTSSRG